MKEKKGGGKISTGGHRQAQARTGKHRQRNKYSEKQHEKKRKNKEW